MARILSAWSWGYAARTLIAVAAAGCVPQPMQPSIQAMPGPGKSVTAFQSDTNFCRNLAANQVQRVFGTNGGNGPISTLQFGNQTWQSATQGSTQQVYDNAFADCMITNGEIVPGRYVVKQPPQEQPAPLPVPDPLVRAVQAELIRLHYLNDGADGFIGPKTRGAINAFEAASQMAQDGAATPRLLGALKSSQTQAAQSPPPSPVGDGDWTAAPATPAPVLAPTAPAATDASPWEPAVQR